MRKRFILFALLYTAITVYYFYRAKTNESTTVGVMFVMVFFWITAGVALGITLYLSRNIKYSTKDYIAIAFCTPVPTWIFLFIISTPYLLGELTAQTGGKEKYFEENNTHRKEITYKYFSNGLDKRIENYKQDKNGNWVKDGRWLFFEEDGSAREQVFRNDSLLKEYKY